MGTRQKATSTRLPEQLNITRQCPYCGKWLSRNRSQCPHCRETLPEIRIARFSSVAKRDQIRRGLLYILLAAVIHYFTGGYSAMDVPFPIARVVADYLWPLLLLGGLGLTFHGFYLRFRE
jgi:hypothetical protein